MVKKKDELSKSEIMDELTVIKAQLRAMLNTVVSQKEEGVMLKNQYQILLDKFDELETVVHRRWKV